jgi:hypothetical protein
MYGIFDSLRRVRCSTEFLDNVEKGWKQSLDDIERLFLNVYDTLDDDELDLFGLYGLYVNLGYTGNRIQDDRPYGFMTRLDFKRKISPLLYSTTAESGEYFKELAWKFYTEIRGITVHFFATRPVDDMRKYLRDDHKNHRIVVETFLKQRLHGDEFSDFMPDRHVQVLHDCHVHAHVSSVIIQNAFRRWIFCKRLHEALEKMKMQKEWVVLYLDL